MDIILNGRLEQQIYELMAPSLAHIGYEIVRVLLIDTGKRKTLQIMIDRLDNKTITIEDCEKASHHASALLDVEDIIDDRYHLEVSSPGVDRPLTRPKDFERYKGHEVKIQTRSSIDGQRKFRGVLHGMNADGEVLLSSNMVPLTGKNAPQDQDNVADDLKIAFDHIDKAQLVLTDALLKSVSDAS